MNHIALLIDIVLSSFAFGATVWFFFVQSPALLKWMGKERFIPIQMRMTRVLFGTLSLVVPLIFAMALVHGQHVFWLHVATLGLAMLGALVNAFVIVPRALKAGGRALGDLRSGSEAADDSAASFASVGGGEASKAMHRLVVVFVVMMLGGLIGHGAVLLHHGARLEVGGHEHGHVAPSSVGGASAHAHEGEERHGNIQTGVGVSERADSGLTLNEGKRWKANPETTAGVRALHGLVKAAMGVDTAGANEAGELKAAYETIFRQCTMTGPEHDQLHSFLIPIGDDLRTLATKDEARKDTLGRLDERLEVYGTYFE